MGERDGIKRTGDGLCKSGTKASFMSQSLVELVLCPTTNVRKVGYLDNLEYAHEHHMDIRLHKTGNRKEEDVQTTM